MHSLIKYILAIFFLTSAAGNIAAQSRRIVPAEKNLLAVAGFLASPPADRLVFTSSIPAAGTGVRDLHRTHVLTLQLNPALDLSEAKKMEITFYLTIFFDQGGQEHPESRVLKVNYDPTQQYTARESFVKEDVDAVRYQLDSVIYIDNQAGPIPLVIGNTVNPLIAGPFKKDLVLLKQQLQYDRYLPPNQEEKITGQKSTIENPGYLTFRWPAVPWASAYDLEYTWIDNYGEDLATPILPANTPYDFRHNCTRIRIIDTLYEIPLVFERGYLLYRIRPIGYAGKDLDKMVTGKWSLDDKDKALPANLNANNFFFTIAASDIHENDKKNWQAIAAFSENGKRKDAINYLDGTSRNRQNVSNLSTGNSLLVNEVIYDYFGRQAIEGMPAPVTTANFPAGHAPAIAFQDSFTLNTANPSVPYSWKDFDRSTNCFPLYPPVANSHGAGKYYSPKNKLAGLAFTPDAGGYPFIQKEYMPDNTGRLKRLGGPGITHSMNTNTPAHAQKFYYSTPAQQELDVVFGNDAGSARYYAKEVRIDPNGLAAITYKDNNQRTVATALAGKLPAALDSIESAPAYNDTIRVNIINEQSRVDSVAGSISAAYSFTLTAPAAFQAIYKLTLTGFPFSVCKPAMKVCYDCIYDLSIRITDECGDSVWYRKDSIGRLTDIRTCENAPPPYLASFDKQLQPGNYQVSSMLTVNRKAIDSIVTNYIADPCWTNITIPPLPLCDPIACTMDTLRLPCKRFEDGVLRPALAHLPFFNGDGKKDCFIKEPTDFIGFSLQKMLADLSPGGQYASYYQATPDDVSPSIFSYPLSVLNIRNQLPTKGSWRRPVTPYRYENGALILIDTIINGVHKQLPPEELVDWQQFVNYWRPSMAYSLLPYHPEYCIYEWCVTNKAVFTYHEDLFNTNDFQTALSKYPDLFKPGFNTPDNEDPLFKNRAPILKQRVADLMDNIKLLDPRQLPMPPAQLAATAAITAAGFGFPVNEQDLIDYVNPLRIYQDPLLSNDEWNAFKTFYLQARTRLLDSVMKKEADTVCCYRSGPIGDIHCNAETPQCLLYRDKRPVFALHSNIYNLIDTTRLGENAAPNAPATCGNCVQTLKLPQFLNQMLEAGKLYTPTRISGPFLSSIANPNTDHVIAQKGTVVWIPDTTIAIGSIARTLRGLIAGVSVTNDTLFRCTLNLVLNTPGPAFSWKQLIGFSCLATSNAPDIFSLKAYDQEGADYPMNGNTTCIDMHSCSATPAITFTHEPAEYIGHFIDLVRQLLSTSRINTSGTGLIIPAGRLSGRSQPSPLYKPGKDPVYQWHITQSIPIGPTGMTIPIKLSDAAPDPEASIRIDAQPHSASLSSFGEWRIIKYEFVTPTNLSDNECGDNHTIRVQAESIRNPIRRESFTVSFDPFPLGMSCSSRREDSLCCLPIMAHYKPKPEPDCDSLRRLNWRLAELMRLEQLRQRMADSLRRHYTLHCLQAAQSFVLTYKQSTYQYTLFYYDQAGNLTKTIPPAGVHPLPTGRLAQVNRYREEKQGDSILPSHTMATTYEYNAANSPVQVLTPDAGRSRNAYDEAGRLIYTQDAAQFGTEFSVRKASFIAYDSLGRITQTGQVHLPGTYNTLPPLILYNDLTRQLTANNDSKTDVFTTWYDSLPATEDVVGGLDAKTTGLRLHNLRNRPALTLYHKTFQLNKPYTHAFAYSYDIRGNIDTLIQDLRGLEEYALSLNLCNTASLHRVKKITYTYDPVINKVKMVWYQPNHSDQFIHRYEYDADERLTAVRTTTRIWEDTSTIDKDASYQYYLHGPLARMQLGQEKIQGLDYVYTIQGWLKGVNAVTLNSGKDPGLDGTTNSNTLKDAMAYSLNYFQGDYQPVGGTPFTPIITNTKLHKDLIQNQLFNGNIHHMITAIDAFKEKNKIQASFYKYDALNRIKQMRIYRPKDPLSDTWTDGDSIKNFRTAYRYDANGNLRSMERNNEFGQTVDSLEYKYTPNTNRLESVEDKAGRITPVDLDKQNTYTYDAAGRRLTEKEAPQAPVTLQYAWTNFDKPLTIRKNGASTTFEYNAAMQRTWKYEAAAKAATYYVRDLQGNTMAMYTIDAGKISLTQMPLYGGNRIGLWYPNMNMDHPGDSSQLSYKRGSKDYELSNHLGNILTTVSDRRLPVNGQWTADIRTAQDYYPFGYPMPGRSLGQYPYGFNGQEKDNEINGEGAIYNFNARLLDTRIGGRFITIDPLYTKAPGESPYAAMSNNPIANIDPGGKFSLSVHWKTIGQSLSDAGISKWNTGLYRDLHLGITVYADFITGPGDHHFDGRKDFDAIQRTWTGLNQQIDDRIPKIGFFNKILGGYDVYRLAVNLHEVQDFYSHSNYVELYIEYYGKANNGAFPTEVPIYEEGIKIKGFRTLMERTTYDKENNYEGLHTGTFSLWKFVTFRQDKGANTHFQMEKDDADTPKGKLAQDAARRDTGQRLSRLNGDKAPTEKAQEKEMREGPHTRLP